MYKRVFHLFLKDNLTFKKDVYEKSMELKERSLTKNYTARLQYEQEEIHAMLEYAMSKETNMFRPQKDGMYCKLLNVVINEENLHRYWNILEKCIFPKSDLTWMEYIFGPVYELFRNPELNDFLLEWYDDERETVMELFLSHTEEWDYQWMNYYKDIQENPTHYEGTCKFPCLPRKIPKCLGHISGCENRSHHICQDCIYHFNDDSEYAYTGEAHCQGDCNIQVPATPQTSPSIG